MTDDFADCDRCTEGLHLACEGTCPCLCPWLAADVWLAFPSLRRIWIEEPE